MEAAGLWILMEAPPAACCMGSHKGQAVLGTNWSVCRCPPCSITFAPHLPSCCAARSGAPVEGGESNIVWLLSWAACCLPTCCLHRT